MKVCTDSCVFGAFVACTFRKKQLPVNHILDIGTGTGLLSLFLAQETTGMIDAIEIDKAAFEEAKQNFELSPWKQRLNVFNKDALQFRPRKKYDLIITNPPFYEASLRSFNEKRNAAKHDTGLTLEQLLTVVKKNLSEEGTVAVLLPFYRVEYFEKEAAGSGFFLSEKLLLKHTIKHPYYRGMLIFARKKIIPVTKELIIKNEDGNYSREFTELLKDYYLYL